MRKATIHIFIVLILSTILTFNMNAQNIKINVNPLQVSGITPIIFGIQFDKQFNKGNILGVAVEYYHLEPNFSGDGEYNGIRTKLTYRRYINNTVFYKGFFISSSLNYLHTSVPEVDEPDVNLKTGIRNGIGIGLSIGRQLIIGKNISLGFALGPVYYKNHIVKEFVDLSTNEYWANRLEFDLEISIGWIIK